MWALRPDGSNPRKHIKKYPEEKRERFLSPAELKRVGEVLREMEEEGIELPSSIAAARLLILTGCRLGEIMTLRWEHVDIPGKALRLPDSKTGAKVVHLGQPAIDVLENIMRLRITPGSLSAPCPAPGSLTCSHSGNACGPAPASRTFASTICGTHLRPPPWHRVKACR
jgi:integrase